MEKYNIKVKIAQIGDINQNQDLPPSLIDWLIIDYCLLYSVRGQFQSFVAAVHTLHLNLQNSEHCTLKTRYTLWSTRQTFCIITRKSPSRELHLFVIWGGTEQLCDFEPWESSPVRIPSCLLRSAFYQTLAIMKISRWVLSMIRGKHLRLKHLTFTPGFIVRNR